MDTNLPKRVKYGFSSKTTSATIPDTPTKVLVPNVVQASPSQVKYGFSKAKPPSASNAVQSSPSQVKYGFSKTKPPSVVPNVAQASPSQVKYGFSKSKPPSVVPNVAQASPSQVKYGFSKAKPPSAPNAVQASPSQVKYGFTRTRNIQAGPGQVNYSLSSKKTTKQARKAPNIKQAFSPTVEDDVQAFHAKPSQASKSQAKTRKRKVRDVGQDVGQEGQAEQKKEEPLDEVQDMAVKLALKKSVLILGEGGTGKSFLFEKLVRDLGNKLMIAKTAPTGSAALRIGGKTVHSWAGIGRADKDVRDLVTAVKRSRWATKRWQDVDVLILDEVSMVSSDLLDKLDQVGRATRKNDAPFGGIRVVASGDFLQLQPVNGEFCFNAKCFDDLFPNESRIVLTRNFRQQKDQVFRRILSNMRTGSLTDQDIEALQTRVGAQRSGQALYVYATNAEVNAINTAKLAATTGVSKCFKHEFVQYHTMSSDDAARLEAELGNAPCVEVLKLKICARVMLTVNKKFPHCLPKVNGSTGLVVGFDAQGNPKVLFDDNDECIVMKHSWHTSCKKMTRTQYPLVLAWAVTIHKMQGATIPNATLILNLGPHIFSPCQAYVALSRACSLDQVVLEDFDPSSVRSNYDAMLFTNACLQAQQARLNS